MLEKYREVAYRGMTPDSVSIVKDVVYSTRGGLDHKLDILVQRALQKEPGSARRLPLIVCAKGSGFRVPNYDDNIGLFVSLAVHGYVVAMVTYSSFADDNTFLEINQDMKTAIRFLRAHADEYGIDGDKVIGFGSSSGAMNLVFAALTGDDEKYETDEYRDYSDSVLGVVDISGPSDLASLMHRGTGGNLYFKFWERHPPKKNLEEQFPEASPVHVFEKGRKYPPFFIVHSRADELVPFEQSEHLCNMLRDNGTTVYFRALDCSGHSSTMTSDIFDEILEFIRGLV